MKVDTSQVSIPIPGVVITESTIEARIDDDGFHAKGKLAFKIGTFADAVLKAHAGKAGFEAVGTINLHVPGLDKAQGEVTYREGKLSAQITLGRDKFKLPGVKSAKLVVDVTDTAVTGSGEIELKTKAVKKGTIAFAIDKGGNFAITGTAAISVPGLKEGEVSASPMPTATSRAWRNSAWPSPVWRARRSSSSTRKGSSAARARSPSARENSPARCTSS